MSKLVSVIIPFYNRITQLELAINSVLNQTYKNIEIILVDDGSTENILKIQNLVNKNRNLFMFRNVQNMGASYSRNKGIDLAKGDYIAFLDSDDEWLSFKIESQLNFMLKNNLEFSYTSYLKRALKDNSIKLIKVSNNSNYRGIAYKCCIATPTVIIKKNILEKSKFKIEIDYGEDIIFWALLSKKTSLKGLNIPSTIVNVSHNSSSLNLDIQKIGFTNINKFLFKDSILNSLLHKLYFKAILLIKKYFIKPK